MTVLADNSLSTEELSVAQRSATLANLLAENRYKEYIASSLPRWFLLAPSHVREALRTSMQLGQETQQFVAQIVAQIKPIEQFAEPLLVTALAAYGWWDVMPRKYGIKEVHLLNNVLVFIATQQLVLADTLVRLLLPDVLTPQSLEVNLVASTTQQSLLQAAMLNFEAGQAMAGGFASGSQIFEVSGQLKTPRPEYTPEIFARICRDLNLGLQYQWHLDRVFAPAEDEWPADDPRSKAAVISTAFSNNLRYEFECALHIAFMKSEVSAYHYALIINQLLRLPPAGTPVEQLYSTFEVLEFEVSGVMLIWPERKPAQATQSCVVYLPQSPYRTFYAFESFEAFKVQLREWLKAPDFAAYFVQRVPLRHRAEFMRRTDIKNPTWDSLLLRRPPIINEPALLSLSRHKPQTGNPFDVAWQLQLAQIKDDARVLIVPTEDEDTRERLARQAMFLNLGMSLMGLALGFVPVLGEILLASSVIQMGEEVYEGVRAWQHGDRVAALEHLFDITQGIALAAASGAAIKGIKPAPVVDALVPITRVSGQKRLWKPDITGYEFRGVSLAGLQHDAQGLYTVGGRQLISLEGRVFEVKADPNTGHFHLKHSRDANAYGPRLFHHGNGIWIHEVEDPMSWPRSQLLRRLGPEAQGVSDAALEQCLTLSNTTEAILRRTFAENLKLPPLLLDSLRRVRLNDRIEAFLTQMKQGGRGTVEQSDIQLQMMARLPGWPANKVLRVIDNAGATVNEYGADLDVLHPRVQIAQSQIDKGDLLKVTLECLSPSEIEQVLAARLPSLNQKLGRLAQKLGEQAERQKKDLFAWLYAANEVVTPEITRFKQQFASLPAVVIEELLTHLSPEQAFELSSSGRLPLPVLEEARSYVQAVRVNRAVEGICHTTMSSADSETVAFALLPHVAGWPNNVRLVLRDSATGLVIQKAGNASATHTSELIKVGDNYEFHGRTGSGVDSSDHLLEAALNALSPAEQSALGLGTAHPFVDLRTKVAGLAVQQRPEVARLLGLHRIKPWFKSPLRLADGRRGYTLGGRSGHLPAAPPQTLRTLVRDLYPVMSDVQAGHFLYRLRLSPALLTRALMTLKAELDTLRRELHAWRAQTVWSQPRSGVRLMVTDETKQAISQALIRAWRRQTPSLNIDDHLGYELDLNAWPMDCLPELSADFSHISGLNLAYSANGQFPSSFLRKFSKLRVLTLKNCQLRELPDAIASMPDLVHLNLQGNQIQLDNLSAIRLSNLTRLKSLNLVGNVLNRRISVRNMPALEHLLLRYTGISEWPEGVEALAGLLALDLRDNAIGNIPAEVLTAERLSVNRVTALHDNPLNADSLRRLEIYRLEHGISLGIISQRVHVVPKQGILNWALIPTENQSTTWNALQAQVGSSDFFRVIDDLSRSSQFLHQHEDLSQRVWSLIHGMHDHAQMRERVFDIASGPRTCSDGVAMIFADMELHQRVFMAHSDINTSASLQSLARGLFRIELLNRHVDSVIQARVAAIMEQQQGYVRQLQSMIDEVSTVFAPRPLVEMDAVEQQGVAYRLGTPEALNLAQLLSQASLQRRLARLDPLQVQMFYQVKLADALDLPARPTSMNFEGIAEVTLQDLDAAKQYVLLEDSPDAFSVALEQRDFWKEFLYRKYREEFVRSDTPQDERMGALFAARETMPSSEYVTQANIVGRLREQARASLIKQLSEEEIAENPPSPSIDTDPVTQGRSTI